MRPCCLAVLVTALSFAICQPLRAATFNIIGSVQILEGTGTVDRAEGASTTTHALKKGASMTVAVGDTIKTGKGSEAVVRSGKSIYNLESGATLTLDTGSDQQDLQVSAVSLLTGLVTFFIPKRPVDSTTRFTVRAGSVTAAVRGTVFRIDLGVTGTNVDVLKGAVEIGGVAGLVIPSTGVVKGDRGRPGPPTVRSGYRLTVPVAVAKGLPGAGDIAGEERVGPTCEPLGSKVALQSTQDRIRKATVANGVDFADY